VWLGILGAGNSEYELAYLRDVIGTIMFGKLLLSNIVINIINRFAFFQFFGADDWATIGQLACNKNCCSNFIIFYYCPFKQESPADARVTRIVIPTGNSAIRSANPENPCLEPNMEWIWCTVCEIFAYKLYFDFETGVWGHSTSLKLVLFDRAHTTFYSSSIVTMPLSITVSDI